MNAVFALLGVSFLLPVAAADTPLGTIVWKGVGKGPDTLFGNAVGSAGDVNGDGYDDFLVGAQDFDGDLLNEGRTACFLGGPNGLTSVPHWLIEGDVDNGEFGYSVSTAGDVNGDGLSDVVIGARRMGDDHPGEGFVFIYLGTETGLSPTYSQFFDSDENVAFLGCSVAAAGDVDADGFCDVIAGARLLDLIGTDGGAAFLYRGSSAGADPPSWSAGLAQHGALFGYSVSGAGDVDADGFADVVIGAYESNDGVPSEGRLFGYRGGPNGLPASASWIGDLDLVGAHLGFSVRIAGDVNGDGFSDVIAGAPEFSGTSIRQGAAFLFAGSAGGLGVSPSWSASGKAGEMAFGHSVGTAGDVNGDGYADVMVGAPNYDVTLNGDEGRVELFLGSSDGLAQAPVFVRDGAEVQARFGYHVGCAGDLDGDGCSEFAAGAPFSASAGFDSGTAFVFAGAGDDLADDAANTISGTHVGEGFASSLAALSDVDGDGFFDLAIGSAGFDPGSAPNAGRAIVLRGGPTGVEGTPIWTHSSGIAGSGEGRVVIGPGDVDGDGHADLVVAGVVANGSAFFRGANESAGFVSSTPDVVFAPDATFGEVGSRAAALGDVDGDGFADFALRAKRVIDGGYDVRVYRGGPTGPVPMAMSISLPANGGEIEVAGAGDFDLDGRDDVLVSLPLAAAGVGEVRVLRVATGIGGGFESVLHATAFGIAPFEGFGVAIAGGSDFDGDGAADFAVGSPDASAPTVASGRAEIFLGGGPSLSLLRATTHAGAGPFARFGSVLAPAGDIDRDGHCDLLVAAKGANLEGAVDLFLGAPGGTIDPSAFSRIGAQVGDALGAALAGGFDANGDGFSDVGFSTPGADDVATDAGRVDVHLGGGGPGRAVAGRLTRAGSSLPIAPHGFSTTANVGFEIATTLSFGRGRVRIEWEVAPEGEPFETSPATKRGLGVVVDSAMFPTLRTDSSVLGTGRVHHRFRLRTDPASVPNLSHGPWISVPDASRGESTLRIAPTASMLALSAPDPLVLSGLSGGPIVTSSIEIANLGGETLAWSGSAVGDAAWLDLDPNSGFGLLASAGPFSVEVRADPSNLDPGEHLAILRFFDLAAPTTAHDVAVKFAISTVPFTPGDRVEAALGPIGDHAFGEFQAVEGMKLKLALIEGTAFGSKYEVRLLDSKGATLASRVVSPSDKPKANFTFEESGLFRIRIERLGGPSAKVAFSTARVLPAEAGPISKTVKKGAGKEKVLTFVALADTLLDLELAPNAAFVGPLAATLIGPDASEFSLAELGTPFGNGGYRITGHELAVSGRYELRLLDFIGAKKEKVKVKIEPTPPSAGTSVVTLKATPAR